MPIGGKLTLKGGHGLKGVTKRKKKSKKPKAEKTPKETPPSPISESQISSGKTYEEEFDIETQRAQTGKGRSTPWGTSFAKPPKILHGYSHEIKGDTAEKRLDIRCAQRTDKFCK